MSEKRTHRVNFMLSKDERLMVEAMAKDAGITMSDYLRQMMRRQYGSLTDAEKADGEAKYGKLGNQ